MPLYREFNTQAELDLQYAPERWVGDQTAFMRVIEGRQPLVERAKAEARSIPDVAYGPTRIEKLDIYPAASANAPVFVFIHGGYWFDARLTRLRYNWIAAAFQRSGIATFVIDYAVCPDVTIDEITRQCRAAIAWIHGHAAEYGGDPGRIYICGSSAGGHLTGMIAVTDWEGQCGLPPDLVKGGCPISGLFDLSPFPYTWLQPKLQLDWAEVRRNSPLGLVRPGLAPPLVVFGNDESPEFHRQSADFATACRAAGNQAELLPLMRCNHWTATTGPGDTESAFFGRVLDHMDLCWRRSDNRG
jgi:arylformamidase